MMRSRMAILAVLAVCSISAIALVSWLSAAGDPAEAAGGPPEMHLELPGGGCTGTPGATPPNLTCTRYVGNDNGPGPYFTVSIRGSRPAGQPIIAFISETFLGGLSYTQSTCPIEVTMRPLTWCLGPEILAGGQVLHGNFTIPPGPDWNNSPVLADIPNVQCPAAGQYTISLTAAGGPIPGGSVYYGGQGNRLYVKIRGIEQLDPDGNGIPQTVDIADKVTVNCVPKPADNKLSLDAKAAGCATPIENICSVPVGTSVTVSVVLSELLVPDLDGDTAAGYAGVLAHITYPTTSGFDRSDRSGVDEVVWPDCFSATLVETKGSGNYTAGCTIAPSQQESTYRGVVVEADFNCNQPGAYNVTLVPGEPLNTYLLDEQGNFVLPKTDSIVISCIVPTPTPTPTPKDPTVDTDHDGCTDVREQQTAMGSESSGGRRDKLNFWDFFDTPNPNLYPQRNRVVSIDDVFREVLRFAATGDANVDPLSTPGKTGYHPAYDRTFVGPDPWDLGPADGVIGIDEIFWVAAQFAHNCT